MSSVSAFVPFLLTGERSVNDLRLRLPKPITTYQGTINATVPATQCIQLVPPLRSDLPLEILEDLIAYITEIPATTATPQSEDCAWAVCSRRSLKTNLSRSINQRTGARRHQTWGEPTYTSRQ